MTKSKKTRTLTPDTVKAYRDNASGIAIVDRIAALNGHSQNHNAMLDAGLKDLAMAAEWTWLTESLVLAQSPASSLDEATLKVAYLEMTLADWVLPGAHRHPNVAGMLFAAVAAERQAWPIPTDKSHLH